MTILVLIYNDYGDTYAKYHLLISTGHKGGICRPKYCPECCKKI